MNSSRPIRTEHLTLVLLLAAALLLVSACDPANLPAQPTRATSTSTTESTVTPGSSDAVPADLSVTYEFRAGSMPPPYHNEYTVTIGPGTQGKVVYRPDYPSDKTPTWTETFSVTEGQLADLYALLVKKRLLRKSWSTTDNPPVGGSVEWATITANGNTYSIPLALNPSENSPAELYDFIRTALVPQAIWDTLEAKRTEYQDNYRR